MMIYGVVDDQSLRITQDTLVSDSINFITAEFRFSERWHGLEKWVHFTQGDTTYDVMLIDDRIAEEQGINLPAGTWDVYLHGNANVDGEVTQRATTEIRQIVVAKTGILDGEPLPPIPPSAAEQIAADAANAREIAQSVRDDADAGVFDGEDGEDGVGIESTVMNADYTLTITLTDGTSYTTPPLRGAKGDKGDKGDKGEQGEQGNGIASTVLNSDYTLTITFDDGTTYTTPSIRGATGPAGQDGYSPSASVSKSGDTATITITDQSGTTTAEVKDGPAGPKGDNLYAFHINEEGNLILEVDGETSTTWSIDENGDLIAEVNGQEVNIGHVKGNDAPQIDDDHALSTNPWSGAKVDEELTDIKSTLSEKQDAPTTPGTAGQVLALDASLNPVWADGGSGGSTDHRMLTHRDDAGAHPVSAITGLQTALEGCVAKQQGSENVGKIMKVDANGELNLANFYNITSNPQGGNTLTI